MKQLCKTEGGQPIKAGSLWKEQDSRFKERIVEVAGYDAETDRVQIKGPTGRLTWARRRRFNGTGGYFECDSKGTYL